MTTIIAGHFIEQQQSDAALAKLVAAGFSKDQVSAFFCNPPGQHDTEFLGGDEEKLPDGRKGGPGAVSGALEGGAVGAVAGVAAVPVLGPAAALAGAAVGAYVGSLQGAVDTMGGSSAHGKPTSAKAAAAEPRKAGLMLAVATPTSAAEASALGILRSAGATDIERAAGSISGGDWTDFDPNAPVVLVNG